MTRAPARTRSLGRRKTGRPGTDHQHVAEGISPFIAVGIGLGGNPAEPGRAPDQRLVDPAPRTPPAT